MTKVSFEAKLFKIKDWTILRLPVDASAKLPTRAMTMVSGTINGVFLKHYLSQMGYMRQIKNRVTGFGQTKFYLKKPV